MRRGASFIVVAVGVVLLLGSYIVYTQRVVVELRREAERSGRMYAQVFEALADPASDPSNALLDRIWQNARWAEANNSVAKETDTPTREKNGWTGDAQAGSGLETAQGVERRQGKVAHVSFPDGLS